MEKMNLLEIDLQHFADEVEDAGENEVEEAAEPQEETEADETETVEESGNDEPQEQSAEENARYAAIRRRAEEDARRRYEGEMNQMNQTIAAMCQGVTHPVTGQPITNVRDYMDALAIQQRQASERELQDKGIDPTMIDRMVAQSPAVIQANQFVQQMQYNEATARIAKDVEEIGKLDPNIKSVEDLANLPYKNELVNYCQQHGTTLTEAYIVRNFSDLMSNRDNISRQQAINQMRGKAHLQSQGTNVATEMDDTEVPAEIMARFKAEGKTEKQIRELYKKVPH